MIHIQVIYIYRSRSSGEIREEVHFDAEISKEDIYTILTCYIEYYSSPCYRIELTFYN